MSSVEINGDLEWKVGAEHLDEEGFASIWNIATATCGGDVVETRALASKLLCFLCQKGCDFVVVSSTDAEYLDAWFERDNKLLYDWKPESEMVDVMTQHAEVPFEAFRSFLVNQKLKLTTNYSPKRADRVEWFSNQWSVG